MHDRVCEYASASRVTIDDVARRRDLRVGEHIDVGPARRRREQCHRRLRRTEHERGPRGAVDRARVDLVRPPIGIGHAQEPGERLRAGAAPPGGVDEMGLYVDDGRLAAKRRFGLFEIASRALGNGVEAAAVGGVDRTQRCGRPPPVDRVLPSRPGEYSCGHFGDRVVSSDRLPIGRRPRQGRVLVARPRAQERGDDHRPLAPSAPSLSRCAR